MPVQTLKRAYWDCLDHLASRPADSFFVPARIELGVDLIRCHRIQSTPFGTGLVDSGTGAVEPEGHDEEGVRSTHARQAWRIQVPFPVPAHRTQRVELPRGALGLVSRVCMVQPDATGQCQTDDPELVEDRLI